MPSTYAHRRFGADVLARLPEELRDKIEPYRALYDLGLHGPDIKYRFICCCQFPNCHDKFCLSPLCCLVIGS